MSRHTGPPGGSAGAAGVAGALGGKIGAILLVAMLAALATACVRAAPAGGAGAGGRGRTTAATVTAQIDALFAEVAGEHAGAGAPGCAMAVVDHGKVVLARGYGLADLAQRLPITPRTVFDIASTSKQFTAASVLLLAERGRLSLGDDVRKYVPELPRYPASVTLGELIHNTGGLPDYIDLLEKSGRRYDEFTGDADALAVLAHQPDLLFKPGTAFKYSDSGYFLLSLVVRRVTGLSLRQFAAANLFGPLHMTDTQYVDDLHHPIPRRATGYSPAGSGFRIDQSNWQQTGDGAVNSTVLDLAKWAASFDTGALGSIAGKRLPADLLALGTLADGTTLPYAGGLVLDKLHGEPRVRHAGNWCGYRAELMRFPDRHLAVITLCNLGSANPTSLCEKVAELYLD
jgi:CubicO group peptidase (beta-lactamase class C family)